MVNAELVKLISQVRDLARRTNVGETRGKHLDEIYAIDDACSKAGVYADDNMTPDPSDNSWIEAKDEFSRRITALFRAQPDPEDLFSNRTTKGLPFVNEVAKEMVAEFGGHNVTCARRLFLYPN